MSTVTQLKCACATCLCIVSMGEAIQKGTQYFCGEACANGHPNGSGCGHEGCSCHS